MSETENERRISRRPDPGNLRFSDIVAAGDVRLPDFYRLYAGIFTLEEERESLDGFARVLSFNDERAVQAEFGPLREQITIATDPASGRIIGAANYALYTFGEPEHGGGFAASSQLNFLCIDPDFRGFGIGGLLLADLYAKLEAFAHEHGAQAGAHTFVTCEQNNPTRMSAQQLADDLAAAGIDPYDRMRWWRRRGFRRLQFDYCQPALGAGQEPCRYIDFYVRFEGRDSETDAAIPGSVLLEHLRRFFYVSVGKFEQDMSREPNWLRQKKQLLAIPYVGVD